MGFAQIQIRYASFDDGMVLKTDQLVHRKSLPCLSLVQATEGSYGIQIEDSPVYETGTGGCFIAPSNLLQTITHRVDPETGVMRARWAFLDVTLDGVPLEERRRFPVLLPKEREREAGALLDALAAAEDACDWYAALFPILKLLLSVGEERPGASPRLAEVLRYLDEEYHRPLSTGEVAGRFGYSVSGLCRLFRKELGCTPAEYWSRRRLSQAALLLQTTDQTVTEIAGSVGMDDPLYFSKVFRRAYGQPPTEYRRYFRQED